MEQWTVLLIPRSNLTRSTPASSWTWTNGPTIFHVLEASSVLASSRALRYLLHYTVSAPANGGTACPLDPCRRSGPETSPQLWRGGG